MSKALFGRLVGFTGVVCVAMGAMACEVAVPEQEQPSTPDQPSQPTVANPQSATAPMPHSVGATIGVSGDTINAGLDAGHSGETFSFPADVSVTLKGPPGAPAVNLTNLFKIDSESAAHFEPFDVTEPGKYEIVLTAGAGAIVLGNKTTESTLKIGIVRLGFERLANGTMLVPTSAKLTLPTSGSTAGNGATFFGLPSGTKVTAALRTQSGTVLTKSARVADGASSVSVSDVGSGIDVSLIDGDNSMLYVATSAE